MEPYRPQPSPPINKVKLLLSIVGLLVLSLGGFALYQWGINAFFEAIDGTIVGRALYFISRAWLLLIVAVVIILMICSRFVHRASVLGHPAPLTEDERQALDLYNTESVSERIKAREQSHGVILEPKDARRN